MKFGKLKGRAIYRELAHIANKAALENGGIARDSSSAKTRRRCRFHPNEGRPDIAD
jgi:hypothetical protein